MMNKKLKNFYNDILPLELIEAYKNGTASVEEEHIYNSLKYGKCNADRISSIAGITDSSFTQSERKADFNRYREIIEKNKSLLDKNIIPKSSIIPLFRAGQIWRAKRIPSNPEGYNHTVSALDRYVLLMSEAFQFQCQIPMNIINKYQGNMVLLALPISFETYLAMPEDIIFEGSQFLPKFMVQTSLEFNTLTGNLEEYIFDLSPEQTENMLAVYFKSNGMEYSEAVFKRCNVGEYSEIGVEYKKIEEQNLNYLEEPVRLLNNLINVNQIVDANLLSTAKIKLIGFAKNFIISNQVPAWAKTDGIQDFSTMKKEDLCTWDPEGIEKLRISLQLTSANHLLLRLSSTGDIKDIHFVLTESRENQILWTSDSVSLSKNDYIYIQITIENLPRYFSIIIKQNENTISAKQILIDENEYE